MLDVSDGVTLSSIVSRHSYADPMQLLLKHAQHLAVTLGLLLPLQCGAAQLVQLTTEIETVVWDSHGPAVHTKTFTIRCVVGTNTWLIQGDPFRRTLWFTGTNFVDQARRPWNSFTGTRGSRWAGPA